MIGGLFRASDKNSVSQHGRNLAVRLERDVDNEVIVPLSKARNSRAYRTNLRTLLYSWPTASAVSWSKTYGYLIAPYSMIRGVNSPLQAVRRSEASRRRIKLIVFLGILYRGSGLANWGEIISNLVRLALQDSHKKIIETLEVDSEVLGNIHE